MTNADKTKENAQKNGLIDLCPYQSCGFKCCQFQQGNYIVLYPGELELAKRQGLSLEHLEVTEAYRGGHKAVCKASDTSTCDNGLKPLDCKSYPYFPVVRNGSIEAGLKGSKCPLTKELTKAHASFVVAEWSKIDQTKVGIKEWIQEVVLVGYEEVDPK